MNCEEDEEVKDFDGRQLERLRLFPLMHEAGLKLHQRIVIFPKINFEFIIVFCFNLVFFQRRSGISS